MIVYWVALAETLFYLCAIPLHVALRLNAGSGFEAAAGFSIFCGRFAERRADALMKKPKKKRKKKHALKAHSRARLVLRILVRQRLGKLSISGRFSAGDAAGTALIMGAVNSLEYALRPLFPGIILSIVPDFNASISYAQLRGMVTLKSGQVIRAALSGAFRNSARRIRQWTDTLLKTS